MTSKVGYVMFKMRAPDLFFYWPLNLSSRLQVITPVKCKLNQPTLTKFETLLKLYRPALIFHQFQNHLTINPCIINSFRKAA